MSDADIYEIFASALETIYDEVPVTLATTNGAYVHERSGRRTITVRTPETCSQNWELQADGVWQAARYLADHLPSNLEGKHILELGAGAGLPGIVAAFGTEAEPLCVVLSDYPDAGILKQLKANVQTNRGNSRVQVEVHGHCWGVGNALEELGGRRFDVVLAADVLWKQELHQALCRTLAQVLETGCSGRVHIVAGLHTGRGVLSNFISCAQEERLELDKIYEVSAGSKGIKREWAELHEGETIAERRGWLVVAVLRHVWSCVGMLEVANGGGTGAGEQRNVPAAPDSPGAF